MWKKQIVLVWGVLMASWLGAGCILDWDEDGNGDLCGNSVIDSGEECDDGRLGAGQGCSATCKVAYGWACIGEPSLCSTTCGDGIIAVGAETCDDGFSPPTSFDGCSSSCQEESNWTCTGEPSTCIPGGL